MKHIIHPDLLALDLPRIEQEMNDPSAFAEFSKCLDKAIKEIERDPINEGAPLERPPLRNYRKKKFHSLLKPPQKQSADMRLVFRYDVEADELFLLGVGKRKSYQPNDVYAILTRTSRNQ